jgi:hypothetical protein
MATHEGSYTKPHIPVESTGISYNGGDMLAAGLSYKTNKL